MRGSIASLIVASAAVAAEESIVAAESIVEAESAVLANALDAFAPWSSAAAAANEAPAAVAIVE